MIYVIGGPTASGKTTLAIWLAKLLRAPIINADAFQIYQGMDIGTNKNMKDFHGIHNYLFDIVKPDQAYSVARYQHDVRQLFQKLDAVHQPIVMVGGTGLYMKASIYDFTFTDEKFAIDLSKYEHMDEASLYQTLVNLDPQSAKAIHPHNRRRVLRAIAIYFQTGKTKTEQEALQKKQPIYPCQFFAIESERTKLYQMIDDRVEQQFDQGLIEEVKGLLAQYPPTSRAFEGIGYKEVIAMLQHNFSLNETKTKIKLATRRYAKRQFTYFKHQLPMQWFASLDEAKEKIGISIDG
jgi:tRNA dimethylallyltransferase